ncbi:hypothetical protein IFM89_002233, partial [Coptis chinensis]
MIGASLYREFKDESSHGDSNTIFNGSREQWDSIPATYVSNATTFFFRYGLFGKKFKDTFGHVGGAMLGGLLGLNKPETHGVPYSLTEEFVNVYRMHSLLPDNLLLIDTAAAPGPNKTPPLIEEVHMVDVVGLRGEKTLFNIGFTKQMVSMGHQASGALKLFNYPMFLKDLIAQNTDGKDRPDHVDLTALEDLTDDVEAINALRDVYGDDVEEFDLL